VQCLARADLVLYDYLVNSQILEHAPSAEKVCLGRHGHGRIVSQDEVNERLVAAAGEGKIAVRLKSGDPGVFARAAEEAGALEAAGIAYEIVPGVTAAIAVSSYAGIPITHRDLASAVALITGQEMRGKAECGVDFDALARFPGTLVFYMGVTTAPDWSTRLITAGKPPETPVAIVRRCSWPDQQALHTSLDELASVLAAQRLRPPAVIVVGDVAPLGQTLSWFEQRPLFGQTVLVTRPIEQARRMRAKLAELGANVQVQPAIEICDPTDWTPVDDALHRLATFDWLVFSSANGVQYLLDRLPACGLDLRALGGVRLAAIGPATVERLAEHHLLADIQPDEHRAEALAEALAGDAAGKRILLARASRGREVLSEQLITAGAEVEQVVAYTSRDTTTSNPDIAEALREGRVDWVTVTSSAIARSLVGLFGDDLRNARLATISPITSEVLRCLGHEAAVEAAEYTTDGVIEAIMESGI
jgi:uroporphyrinogen III methyltransferase/synthase